LTKVDAGDFKHELLNRLRSTMAVNVLIFVLMKHEKVHDLILLYFGHFVKRIQNIFWGLDWANELIYAQVTSIQLESSEVFMGREPAQRGPISLYYYSTRLEARWISGCMWRSLWYCRNVWVSVEV